jgi:hypothetical protein
MISKRSIATIFSRVGGIAAGAVRWSWGHRRGVGTVISGVVIAVIAAGVIAIVGVVCNPGGSPSEEVQDVTATLSLVNGTANQVGVSNWLEYELVEFYTGRAVEGPRVLSRPHLVGSQEPLDNDITLNPGDHVELLLDVRVDRSASALLDRGSGELWVIAHLSNGKPIVGSLPFQRDTLSDLPLVLRVEDEQ